MREAWLLIGLVFLSVMLPFAVQPVRADGDQVTATTVTMTASYTIAGGGTGYSAPTLNYRQGGIDRQYTLTETPAAISADQGSTWSVTPNPLYGSNSSERWYSSQSLSGTASAGTYLFSFYHQYYVTVAYWVASGSGYSAPTFTGNKFGTPDPETFADVPPSGMTSLNEASLADWFDTGQWTMTNILPGSSNTERWTLLSNDSLTIGGTLRYSTYTPTYVFAYHDQYSLAMTAEGEGLVTADNGPNPAAHALGIKTSFTGTQVLDWQDVNRIVTITAAPNDGNAFYGWAGTGAGSYTGTDNPTEVTMSSPLSETATFGNEGGVGVTVTSDPAGAGFVAVDGTPFTTPRTFIWMPGDNHTLTANTPVLGADGNGYVFQSWDGICSQILQQAQALQQDQALQQQGQDCHLSPTINYTVPNAILQLLQQSTSGLSVQGLSTGLSTGTTFTANYQTQYYLSMKGDAVSPALGWYNSSTSVTISDSNQAFMGWTGVGDGSYTGTDNPANVTMNGPVTEIANFAQVQVTVDSSPEGTGYVAVDGTPISTPQIFNWTVGSTHTLSAQSDVDCGSGCQYTFSGWSDGGEQSHRYVATTNETVTAKFTATEVANTTAVNITVTSPVGGGFMFVDGNLVQSPQQTFTWNPGDTHKLSAISPASCGTGCQFVFASWTSRSVGTTNSSSFAYTVPSSSETVTDNYETQYYLSLMGQPGGITYGTDWYGAGSSVQISANPKDPGYVFTGWIGMGAGSYTGMDNPASIVMNNPITETAQFQNPAKPEVQITIDSDPEGPGFVTVSGDNGTMQPVTTPYTVTGHPGDQGIGVATPTVACGDNCQYLFVSWTSPSIGNVTTPTLNYTVPSSSETVTANYKKQYYLTMQVDPSSASVSLYPGSGWQFAGRNVTISADARESYAFVLWTGSGFGGYYGTNNPSFVIMNGPITETANFQTAKVTMTVNCVPSSVALGSSSTCTATVTGSSPTGTVSWSQSGSGSVTFSASSCTPSGGSCSVTARGSTVGGVTVQASYGGDSSNNPSSGTASLTVTCVTASSSVPGGYRDRDCPRAALAGS